MVPNENSRETRLFRRIPPAAAIAALAGFAAPATALAAEVHEYAAGEVALPFAYAAVASSAPRPAGLDFADMDGYPDNCQVFVRMEGELWEFKRQSNDSPAMPNSPARLKGPDIDHLARQEDAIVPPGYQMAWFLGGMWYDDVERKLYAPMQIEGLGTNRDAPVAP